MRNERMLLVIQPLHVGFYYTGWSWELLKSQEHSIKATALVMPWHLQALEGCSLERCWEPLHLQRWPTTHVEVGGQVAAWSVREEAFGLILVSMLHLVSLEKPAPPLAASSVFYCLNNGLSKNLFSWSCLHLCVNVVNVRGFFCDFKKDFCTTKLFQAKMVLPHTSHNPEHKPVCR